MSVTSKKSKNGKSGGQDGEISEGQVTKQSKIEKYYTRKQIIKQDYFDALDSKKMPEKGLGFATPVLEVRKDLINESLKKSEKSGGGRHGNILTQIAESEASPEREIAKTVVSYGDIKPFSMQSNLGRNACSQKGTAMRK